MKETISDDLSARYIDSAELIDKCSYLDPRFKTRYPKIEEMLLQIKSEATVIADDIYWDNHDEVDELPPTKKSKGLGAIYFDQSSWR